MWGVVSCQVGNGVLVILWAVRRRVGKTMKNHAKPLHTMQNHLKLVFCLCAFSCFFLENLKKKKIYKILNRTEKTHPDKKLVLNGVGWCGVVWAGFGWCWVVLGVGWWLVVVRGFIRVRCALRVCGQFLGLKIDLHKQKPDFMRNLHKIGFISLTYYLES